MRPFGTSAFATESRIVGQCQMCDWKYSPSGPVGALPCTSMPPDQSRDLAAGRSVAGAVDLNRHVENAEQRVTSDQGTAVLPAGLRLDVQGEERLLRGPRCLDPPRDLHGDAGVVGPLGEVGELGFDSFP